MIFFYIDIRSATRVGYQTKEDVINACANNLLNGHSDDAGLSKSRNFSLYSTGCINSIFSQWWCGASTRVGSLVKNGILNRSTDSILSFWWCCSAPRVGPLSEYCFLFFCINHILSLWLSCLPTRLGHLSENDILHYPAR